MKNEHRNRISYFPQVLLGEYAQMSVTYCLFCSRMQNQHVVSFRKTLYPRCFSRLSCELSTRREHPREGCSFCAVCLLVLTTKRNFLSPFTRNSGK